MSDHVARPDKQTADWQQLNLDRLEKLNSNDIQVLDVQANLPEDSFRIFYDNSREIGAPDEFVNLQDDALNQDPDALRSTATTTPPGEVDAEIVEAKKGIDEATHKLEMMLNAIESYWDHLINHYEEQLLKLICQVAETIIYTQIGLDREVVKRTILNVFKTIPQPTNVSIHIHPDDYEQIDTAKAEFFENIQTLKQVSVVSDTTITRGGCRVMSDVGAVNTDIEARLEDVKSSLMEAWAAHTNTEHDHLRQASDA